VRNDPRNPWPRRTASPATYHTPSVLAAAKRLVDHAAASAESIRGSFGSRGAIQGCLGKIAIVRNKIVIIDVK
jgi:hypothetical protein